MLEAEKTKHGVLLAEETLSKHNSRSNDSLEYAAYLCATRHVEREMRTFYLQGKWRVWRFRIFCKRRSSEHRLLDRIARHYGEGCKIHNGNWSRNTQMKGCTPTPNMGMKRLLSQRFRVVEVDEFKTCNSCMGSL